MRFRGWPYCLYRGCSFRAPQGKPVVPPPAKLATNRAESEEAKEAIEQTQLGWFESNRVAARADSPYPQYPRQPIWPGHRFCAHPQLPFSGIMAGITAQFLAPRWNSRRAMRAGNGRCRWPGPCRNQRPRNRDEPYPHPHRWFGRRETQRP